MKKIVNFKLGHPDFLTHDLKVIKADSNGYYLKVNWGTTEIDICSKTKRLKYTVSEVVNFNGDEHDHKFGVNLFQAKVQQIEMLCLQIIYNNKDRFFWVPKSRDNYERIVRLINNFDWYISFVIKNEESGFNWFTLINVAKEQLPHFEVLKYLEIPQETKSFNIEPALQKEIDALLSGILPSKNNRKSRSTSSTTTNTQEFVLPDDTDLTVKMNLYHPNGVKKSDHLLDEEYYARLNLEAIRMYKSGLFDKINRGESYTDEEYQAVLKGNFVVVHEDIIYD